MGNKIITDKVYNINQFSFAYKNLPDINLFELNSLYNQDKKLFFNVLIDLKIRGYKFSVKNKKFKKLFYNPLELDTVIVTSDSGENFKKIDFEKFGLGSFIYRFDLENDLFFNGIYLNGFKLINPNIDIEELKEEFINVGYDISNYDLTNSFDDNHKIQDETITLFHTNLGDVYFLKDVSINNLNDILLSTTMLSSNYFDYILFSKLKENIEFSKDELIFLLSQSSISHDIYNYNVKNLNLSFRNLIYDDKYIEPLFHTIKELKFIEFLNIELRDNSLKQNDLQSTTYLNLLEENYSKYHFKYHLNELNKQVHLIKEELNPNQHTVLIGRHKGETLQAIADSPNLNVSRERVRQIESNVKRRLNSYIYNNKISKHFNYIYRDEILITEEKILKYFDVLETIIIINIMVDEDNYTYNQDLNTLYKPHKINLPEVLEKELKLNELFHNKSTFITMIENFNITYKSNFNFNSIEKYYIIPNFNKYDNVYVKKGTRVTDRYFYIIENYIGTGYHKFKDFSKMKENLIKYGLYTDDINPRNVFAALERHSNLLLTQSNFYRIKSTVPQPLLNEQKKYALKLCLDTLKKYDEFNLHSLNFDEIPVDLNFESSLHIYSIIKEYYSEKFKFARGNLLVIYPKNNQYLSRTELLEKYVKRNGGLVKKSTIAKDMKFKNYTISQTVYNSERLLTWGNGYVYYLDDKLITKYQDDIEKLEEQIQAQFENTDAIPAETLYKNLLFSGNSNLFTNFKISNRNHFSSFITNIFKDFSTKGIFIVKSSADLDVRDIILSQLPDYFSKINFIEIMKNNDYADGTIAQYLSTNYRNDLLYQITSDTYCKHFKFKIDEDTEEQIINFFEDEIDKHKYVVLEKYLTFIHTLPQNESNQKLKWNPYLIGSILEKNGFISLLTQSYAINLYTNIDDIETFEDLVFEKLKDNKIYTVEELKVFVSDLVYNDLKINPDSLINDFKGSHIKVNRQLNYIEIGDFDD